MSSSPTSSDNTLPSLIPDQEISQTTYVTLFAIGSVVLILVVLIACYRVFRAHPTIDYRFGLSKEKQGLGEEMVDSYPKMKFSQVKIKYGNGSSSGDHNLIGLCCSICLTEFKEVDTVLLLPNCDHFFHVECVAPWLRLHATCPLCRNSHVLIPPGRSLEIQEEG